MNYLKQFGHGSPWLHMGQGTMVLLQNADKETQHFGAGDATNWE